MPGETSGFQSRYKNRAMTQDELRRRREEDSIQLRKQKREEQLSKKRNVADSYFSADTIDAEGGFDVSGNVRKKEIVNKT